MKKLKPFVVGSLLAAFIIATPAMSLADNSNKNENGNQAKNVKTHNSLINRFFGLFNRQAYAYNNNLTPVINGVTAPTVIQIGETGTWTVNASDPQNGSLSYAVNWGDASILPMLRIAQPVFVQGSTFTHSYANKGTYKISFEVSNTAGLKTTSTVTVHVSDSNPSITAPVISNLIASSIKVNKSTISWTTDTKSSSNVWFSKISPVNTTIRANLSKKNKVLNHKIVLNKLDANTKYYVIVNSINNSGTTTSSEISFTTLEKTDNSNPVITSLTGDTTVKAGNTTTITVNAKDLNNESLTYGVNWGDTNIISNSLLKVKESPVFVQSATFNHIYNLPGVYNATFVVTNADGKKDTSSTKITVTPIILDATAPVISELKTLTGDTTSTISWITNELSTSQIYYSKITPVNVTSNETVSIVDNALATNHSLNITGLAKSTLYHFIVKSTDATNNTVVSSESAFMTNSGI